ncbi:Phosphoribosylamine--glycine ligase [compost metagenome]
MAVAKGRLADTDIEWSDEAAVCVVLASQGYPGTYPKGVPITGLEDAGDRLVFHAGTARDEEGRWITNGGRVLGVVGRGASIAEARLAAYASADKIHFAGKQNRSDIAMKALI